MIAISSFRPHHKSSVYRENQIRAHESWEPLFTKIIYLNDYEPDLVGHNTEFSKSDEWPTISRFANHAILFGGGATVINADIVLEPAILKAFSIVESGRMQALTSRRFDLETRRLDPNDRGRDIFICTRRVWQSIAREIPPSCRIGHQQWDSWMMGFLRKTLGTKFGEFTQMRCVFHPRHEERMMPHAAEVNVDGPYTGYWNGTQDVQIV